MLLRLLHHSRVLQVGHCSACIIFHETLIMTVMASASKRLSNQFHRPSWRWTQEHQAFNSLQLPRKGNTSEQLFDMFSIDREESPDRSAPKRVSGPHDSMLRRCVLLGTWQCQSHGLGPHASAIPEICSAWPVENTCPKVHQSPRARLLISDDTGMISSRQQT